MKLQSALAATNYFEGIAVDASPRNAKDYVIPVVIRLTPARRNRYDIRLGYGTDTGARASAGYIRRTVNRHGHSFTADLFLSETTSGVSSEYSIPGSDPQTDRYLIRAGYARVDTTSFTSDRVNLGVSHQQQRRPWRRTLSLDYQIEESEFDRGSGTSKLLLPSVDWIRVSPDDRLRVERGTRLELNVRGAHEDALSRCLSSARSPGRESGTPVCAGRPIPPARGRRQHPDQRFRGYTSDSPFLRRRRPEHPPGTNSTASARKIPAATSSAANIWRLAAPSTSTPSSATGALPCSPTSATPLRIRSSQRWGQESACAGTHPWPRAGGHRARLSGSR